MVDAIPPSPEIQGESANSVPSNLKDTLLAAAPTIILELIALPFCLEGGTAVMKREWLVGLMGFGIGLPIGVAGFAFPFWFRRLNEKSKEFVQKDAIRWWLPISVVMMFVYVLGPSIYRRATNLTGMPMATATQVIHDPASTEEIAKATAPIQAQLSVALHERDAVIQERDANKAADAAKIADLQREAINLRQQLFNTRREFDAATKPDRDETRDVARYIKLKQLIPDAKIIIDRFREMGSDCRKAMISTNSADIASIERWRHRGSICAAFEMSIRELNQLSKQINRSELDANAVPKAEDLILPAPGEEVFAREDPSILNYRRFVFRFNSIERQAVAIGNGISGEIAAIESRLKNTDAGKVVIK